MANSTLARNAVIGGMGLAAVAAAIWFGYANRLQPVEPEPAGQQAALPAPESAAPEAQSPAPQAESATETATTPAPASPAPVVLRPAPPRFDLVRAEVDGMTLVAGVAVPGSDLAILVDDSEAARTRSDGEG